MEPPASAADMSKPIETAPGLRTGMFPAALEAGRKRHGSVRQHLLCGASLVALGLWAARPEPAFAAKFGSQQYFNQLGARLGSPSATGSAAGNALSPSTSSLAQEIAARSQADLTRAAQAIAAAQAAQAVARHAAVPASAIPNGLASGGLAVIPGISSDPSLWQGAQLPTQTTAKGETVVTVKETSPKSILTWQSFNVGTSTTVHFDQSGGTDQSGNNGWVALNRIEDPSGVPSKILGRIKAEGAVYLINRNGILFSGSSRVDVHALIASALDIGRLGQTTDQRNAQFLQQGLNIATGSGASPANLTNVNVAFSSTTDPLTTPPEGSVTVAAGAQITASVQGSDNPGSVLLLAPSVTNEGEITSPAGQVILGAGRVFAFLETTTVSPASGANYLGLRVQSNPALLLQGSPYYVPPVPDYLPGMHAVNGGLIETDRGNITVSGTTVENDGVLAAETSISRNGSIVLAGVTKATLGPNAMLAILPDENGETIPQGQVSSSTFPTPYVQIQAADVGRPSITGEAAIGVGALQIDDGAAVVAPGAIVGLFGGKSVYLSAGSLIDVAGTTSAVLPASANFVTFAPLGPEFANSPEQRAGVLRGQQLTVDIRNSGVRADGISYVGTPLADVSGYVATTITANIDQLLAPGGSVTVATALGNNPTDLDHIVLSQGSTIDVSGGYVTYQAGTTPTTRLIASNGALYDIANADPTLTYVGIAGSYSVAHPQWNVTTTYSSKLIAGAQTSYQPGYIEGRDAGGITLRADALVEDGALIGQAAAGPRQIAGGQIGTAKSAYSSDTRHLQATPTQLPSAGYLVLDPTSLASANPSVAALADNSPVFQQFVQVQSSPGTLPAGFGPATVFARATSTFGANDPFAGIDPADYADTLVLSSNQLDAGGFGLISVRARTREVTGTTLTVADGGAIAISGDYLEADGKLVARAGLITLAARGAGDPSLPSNTPAIEIGPGAILNARGRWVNETGDFGAPAEGAAYTNGGSVSLTSQARSSQSASGDRLIDTTGNVSVDPTAVLDVSSGGYVAPSGMLQETAGVPAGKGGSITLETYAGGFAATSESGTFQFPTTYSFAATVSVDLARSIRGYSFAGGGTLRVSVGPSIEITSTTSSLQTSVSGALLFPSSYFSSGDPFGAFDLESDGGSVVVSPDTHVVLRQSNFQPAAALLSLPTGSDLYAGQVDGLAAAPIGVTAAYQRRPVNLTLGNAAGDVGFYPDAPLSAGQVVVSRGATIATDPGGSGGGSVTLSSIYETDIVGRIAAHGGTVNLEASGNLAGSAAELAGVPVANGAVYLAPSSVVDVSGRTVIDRTNLLYHTGRVLAGGNVYLTANGTVDAHGSFGYVIQAAGSSINLDGAAATLQVPQPGAEGSSAIPELVASDAGELVISTEAGIVAGAVKATAGGPLAAGGILTVTSLGTPDVIIRQQREILPRGFRAGEIPTALYNPGYAAYEIRLSADTLDASGFDDINIGAITAAAQQNGTGANEILFLGPVDLSVGRALRLYGPVSLVPFKSSLAQDSVTVSAPYLLFGTSTVLFSGPERGHGSFTATSDTIVLERGWLDAASATLVASGDVQVEGVLNSSFQNYASGGLIATGNLTVNAGEISPTGGSEGVIQALSIQQNGTATVPTLTILSDGAPSLPLSAGGSLYLLAPKIVQDGNVWAPNGSITLADSESAGFFTFLGNQASTPQLQPSISVTLGTGSFTSTSLDGSSLPYGGTVDARAYYYNDPTRSNTALTSLPSKQVSISAASIDFAAGATLDLSGGGDLYATEFVPGNGGTRDVLSNLNTYTATSFNPATVGNAARDNTIDQVYAILPSANPAAAPSDIDFSTVAGLGDQSVAPGLNVTLSAIAGLPAGTYTLLPASYATLPGAYRVVLTGVSNFLPSQNSRLPDGTLQVSGRITTPLAGEQASVPMQFLVQSGAVWRQYSEIDQTSANNFFAGLTAATSGRIPEDAGHLILSASTALTLAGMLNSVAPAGALGSLVDIASGNTEIADPGTTPLSGYVGLNVDELSAVEAGSLLIGGTRDSTSAGDVVTPTSASILVDNDSAHPLAGPEILLATTGSSDPTARLTVAPGAVIEAKGGASGTAATVIIGHLSTGSTDLQPGAPGDGAFLGISNARTLTLQRENVPGEGTSSFSGPAEGNITVGAGAGLLGGNQLVIDTAGNGAIDPTATLSGANVTLAGQEIDLGSAPSGTQGLLLPGTNLAALSGLKALTLHAANGLYFFGPVDLRQTLPGSTLTLDAGAFVSDGSAVTVSAGTLVLANSTGLTPDIKATNSGTLDLSAKEIDFGAGPMLLAGFGSAGLSASTRVAATGEGSLDAGSAAITIKTPELLAETGSGLALTTAGTLAIASTGTAAAAGDQIGGSLTFKAAGISLDAALLAPAGEIELEATSGDLSLGATASIDAAGTAQSFFDIVRYAPGGRVKLIADTGNIKAEKGSSISVAAAPGGDAGLVELDAPAGGITFDGVLLGSSGKGVGGSFVLRQKTSVNQDSLATLLQAGGFDDRIGIEASAGDLSLTGTLTGSDVVLTAESGAVSIGSGAVIDASGDKGGTIDLFGQTGVDIEGQLLAKGSNPARAGGLVEIGTGGTPSGSYDLTYGFEEIGSAGTVTLGASSVIDVTGGTIDGLSGGLVEIRVPLQTGGTLAVNAAAGAQITGAHDVVVEGYATWSTSDATAGPLHFDGTIDPAGWFDASGQLVAGTDQFGDPIAAGSTLQPGQYFTPTAPDMDHVLFYQQTLMSYVQNFAPDISTLGGPLAGAHLQPGIDLENNSTSIAGGNITVASSWNLGAGGYDQNGALSLFYRTAKGEPGDLTLRAVNNVVVNASITDGFFQPENRLDQRYLGVLTGTYLKLAPGGNSTHGLYLTPLWAPAAPYDTSDPSYNGYVGQYYSAYSNGYARMWSSYRSATLLLSYPLAPAPSGSQVPTPPSPPSFNNPSSYGAATQDYSAYLAYYQATYLPAYRTYLAAVETLCENCATFQAPAPPDAPQPYGSTVGDSNGQFTIAGSLAGLYGANGPADNPTASDPNPVLSSSLFPLQEDPSGPIVGGDGTHYSAFGSWSIKVTAGADLASPDPLATQASGAGRTAGGVSINGHSTFMSPLSKVTGLVPTLVRTGTGSIDIAAAGDFALTDPLAPGTVYTAGRPSAPLASPDYTSVNGGSALNGPSSVAANSEAQSGLGFEGDGTGVTLIGNPDGFDAPDFGNSVVLTAPTLFAVTAPAYSEAGGHVSITAGNDILGVQDTPVISTYSTVAVGYLGQFWSNWLLTRSVAVPAVSGNTAINFNADQGVYNPNASHQTGSVFTDLNDGQTTWWVNFGSFDEGVAALGGGDVTIAAGRNIVQFSAATVASGRVSGGLSASSLPKLDLTGGGDLTVTAGGSILSGTYSAALGKGSITAGGSIGADPSWTYTYVDSNVVGVPTVTVNPSVVLGIGSAQVSVSAAGPIDVGDIVNPTELNSAVTLTVGDDYISTHGGASSLLLTSARNTAPLVFAQASFNTMGPDSAVTVESIGGDVVFETLPQLFAGGRNLLYQERQRLLPASVEATSLTGDLTLLSNFDEVNSDAGPLNLLAGGNIRLAGPDDMLGGDSSAPIPDATSTEAGIATYQTNYTQTISTFFPLPGLVNGQFDPENPAAGHTSATASYVLLHASSSSEAHIYAAAGDVTNGPVADDPAAVSSSSLPMPVLTDEPISVRAGRDVRDLQLYAQQTQAGDVSAVSAKRDVIYDLPGANLTVANGTNGNNLMELAGPGSLVVTAGRNLGPFPNDFNAGPSGIITTGNVAWLGADIDPLLPSTGASVFTFAGVAPGIDYQAMAERYVDPANAASRPHSYAPELLDYLSVTLGLGGLSPTQAYVTFETLSADAQHAFLDQVFFAELQATQQTDAAPSYSRGYTAVNTLFPGSDGYTQNNLSGGSNGANTLVSTGDIDLRSATIQTQRGGSIYVFAPGGNVLLGSSASRPIYNQPGTTGILTFQGGSIDVFADESVIVNQSRILTEEGGDVLTWSSNGDILAGIGAKTSADFPPYTVLYDSNGLQRLDPAGLVTGAGIGALVTVAGQDPLLSNAYLIAPRGTVDAGDAGIRVAGNLFVAALHVANAGNISVGGAAVGIPQAPTVNVGALTAAAAAAANASNSAEQETFGATAQTRQMPSIITIDVIGFGG